MRETNKQTNAKKVTPRPPNKRKPFPSSPHTSTVSSAIRENHLASQQERKKKKQQEKEKKRGDSARKNLVADTSSKHHTKRKSKMVHKKRSNCNSFLSLVSEAKCYDYRTGAPMRKHLKSKLKANKALLKSHHRTTHLTVFFFQDYFRDNKPTNQLRKPSWKGCSVALQPTELPHFKQQHVAKATCLVSSQRSSPVDLILVGSLVSHQTSFSVSVGHVGGPTV